MTTTPRRNSLSGDWTTEQEDLLKQWCEKAACYRWLHENAQTYFRHRHYLMTIPVIIFSTVAGTANFSLGSLVDADAKEWYSMGIGAINLISGLIATLANFFRFAERMESHRSSGIQFSKFQRNISAELALSPSERENARDFVKLCRSEYDKLIEQSPPIPDAIIERFNIEFEDDEDIAKPDMCDGGITPAQVYGRVDNRRIADIMAKAAKKFKQGEVSPKPGDETRIDMVASLSDSLEKISHRHVPNKLELKKRGLTYLNKEKVNDAGSLVINTEPDKPRRRLPEIVITAESNGSGSGSGSSSSSDDSIHKFIDLLVSKNILIYPGSEHDRNMDSIKIIEQLFREWRRDGDNNRRSHMLEVLDNISRGI